MPDAKFDTMAAMQQLQEAGVAERPAQAMVTVVSESQRNLATKEDLYATKTELENQIALLRKDMETEFKVVRLEMREMRADLMAAIADSQNEMTVRVGKMLVGTVAITTTLTTALTTLLTHLL